MLPLIILGIIIILSPITFASLILNRFDREELAGMNVRMD
jgi:hypothetical protein